jgi:hypothetical protein
VWPKARGGSPTPQEIFVIIFIALFLVCDKKLTSVRKTKLKMRGAWRCLGKGVFVIIFIALYLGCDKKLSCVGKRSRENALARWLATKLKHQN